MSVAEPEETKFVMECWRGDFREQAIHPRIKWQVLRLPDNGTVSRVQLVHEFYNAKNPGATDGSKNRYMKFDANQLFTFAAQTIALAQYVLKLASWEAIERFMQAYESETDRDVRCRACGHPFRERNIAPLVEDTAPSPIVR
jgi:hypothetical protein